MYAIHSTHKDITTVRHTDRIKAVQELFEDNSHGVQVYEVLMSTVNYRWAEYRLMTQDEVIGLLYGKVQVA